MDQAARIPGNAVYVDRLPASGAAAAMAKGRQSTVFIAGFLCLIYVLHGIDRNIVNILAIPIQKEFALSDAELGLLTGLMFTLSYIAFGLPLARLADRPTTNRVGLISASVALWSGFTALCGVTQTFTQLILARIGVSIGEAGCNPTAHSLIADSVPVEKRPLALSIYGLGPALGTLFGLLLGGLLQQHLGWRNAFIIVGLPGILVAAIFWLTVREPRHRGINSAASGMRAVTMREALAEALRSRALVYLTGGIASSVVLNYGTVVWTGIFFVRGHGLSVGQTGLWLGLVSGIGGAFGVLLGGIVTSLAGKARYHLALRWLACGFVLATPLLVCAYQVADWRLAFAFLFAAAILGQTWYGPAYGCVPALIGPASRAMTVFLIGMFANLVGLGIAPVVFGFLSDLITPHFGGDSVRWVLTTASLFSLAPALAFIMASRNLPAELRH